MTDDTVRQGGPIDPWHLLHNNTKLFYNHSPYLKKLFKEHFIYLIIN